MAIAVRPSGTVRILEFTDAVHPPTDGPPKPLDLRGDRLSDLGRTVRALLEEGCRRFVVDLGPVIYLDSAGFGELVACRKRAAQEGGDIVLLRPTGKVRDRLEMLRLTSIFRVFDDESKALASFRRKTGGARRRASYISPSTR
jgi:anti-sigma B factor antagonist